MQGREGRNPLKECSRFRRNQAGPTQNPGRSRPPLPNSPYVRQHGLSEAPARQAGAGAGGLHEGRVGRTRPGRTAVLIAMAGLPGTGKSTLAARLAEQLGAVVLDKDRVRAALFPAVVLTYSEEQDDMTMAAVYQAAGSILLADPRRTVILDGRTFLRPGQLRPVLDLAASLGQGLRVIECHCDDAVARRRLEADLAGGRHPAGNRTLELYLAVKAAAEPLPVPHLTLDTGRTPPEECVRKCLEYLGAG